VLRGRILIGLAVSAVATGLVAGCSSTPAAVSAPSVRCTNYVIHGSGKFHDEVWVQVSVTNSTSNPTRYAITAELLGPHAGPGAAAALHTTVDGLVAANSSAVLARKVLTVAPVKNCLVTGQAKS
jgi:hypothetical protein